MEQKVTDNVRTIAVLGGTGKEGKGLAYRWCLAGHKVIIGSRQAEKAVAAADEVKTILKETGNISGMTNPEAAGLADIVVMTVPFSAHRDMVTALKPFVTGKIFVDVTVPIVPPKITKVQMPPAGSAALETKEILGAEVEVVAAFQNISYENLFDLDYDNCDVIVCGGNKEARKIVIELVGDTGLTGWDGGPLENSMVVEGMTSILLGINKQYGVKSSGIKITGVER